MSTNQKPLFSASSALDIALENLHVREIGSFVPNLQVNNNTPSELVRYRIEGPIYRDVRLFVQKIHDTIAKLQLRYQTLLPTPKYLIKYSLRGAAADWSNNLDDDTYDAFESASLQSFCKRLLNRFEPEAIQIEEARITKKKTEAFACKRCPEKYPSNTKLHDHVREKHTKPEKPTPQTPTTPPTPPASPPPAPSAPVSPVSPPSATITMTTPPSSPAPSSPPPSASIEPAASSEPITSPIIPPTTPRKPISWAEMTSRPRQSISRSRLPRPTITTYDLLTPPSTPPHSSILQTSILANNMTKRLSTTRFKTQTSYLTVKDLYIMFHEKLRSASFVAIQQRLPNAHISGNHMRLHQMRITSYFKPSSNNHIFYHFMANPTNNHDIAPPHTRKWKPIPRLMAPRSPPFSTNEKADRPNSATPGPPHGSPTYPPSTSASGSTLAFNKKSADSETMCQSTGIEAEKLKNRGVAFNRFPRQCRHCKQSFTSGNLLHRHVPHCNGSTKGFKHARMGRKLDGPWRKRSNWRYFIDFSCFFANISLIAQAR